MPSSQRPPPANPAAPDRPLVGVYLGLGSNLGDRALMIDAAVSALRGRGILRGLRVSPIYETDAVALGEQPPYLNAVVAGETDLPPAEVLAACLEIEASHGRLRPAGRTKAPRTLDIDLLLHGGLIIDTPALTVPHRALLERSFVLIPLADVAAPGLRHPVNGVLLTTAAPSPSVRRLSLSAAGDNIASQEAFMSEGPSGSGGPTQLERRQTERIPVEMWVEEKTDHERYFRRAGNLSGGGLRLDHTIPLPQGTLVNLTFTLPGDTDPIVVSGEIVSAAGPEDLRMGVKFLRVGDGARAQIDDYLARVGAGGSK